jgi:hypothetical protein
VYKIEQHGRTSLRRPKLSKEEVKRLMKKKKENINLAVTALSVLQHFGGNALTESYIIDSELTSIHNSPTSQL